MKSVLVILNTVTVAACSGVNSNWCGEADCVECAEFGCCVEPVACRSIRSESPRHFSAMSSTISALPCPTTLA